MASTTFEKPLDNDVSAISTNLGSPSSASAVTGADAFSKINTLNSKITDLIKYDTYTGSTTAAGILYAGVPRNRIVIFVDCPGNSIINLDYPIGSTNFLVYTTDGTKLYPVINTSLTIKYWYYEISGNI